MKLCTISGIEIKCNPFTLLIFIPVIFGESIRMYLMTFFSLALHECAHTYTAHRCGVRITEIELQPMGFCARTDGKMTVKDELAIAMAGPVFSIICGSLCILCGDLNHGYDVLTEFGFINVFLGVINLTPALPLDGGRILRSLLETVMSPKAAVVLSSVPGVILSIAFIMLGIYIIIHVGLNITPIILGLLLLIYAQSEIKRLRDIQLVAHVKRGNAIRRGQRLNISHIALNEDVKLSVAMSSLNKNRYNIISVINSSLNETGELNEGELINLVVRYGDEITIKDAMKKDGLL